MRVLYLISVLGHGRGGHFHSLNHISSGIGEEIEVGICSVGPGNSDIINNNPYFISHFDFNGLNLYELKSKLKRTIKKFNPEIIHCFDVGVYNIFTLLFSNKYKIVLNKCGGPNPIDYPFVQNLILFSEENKQWFINNPKFNKTQIEVIPNRVNKSLSDNTLYHEKLPKEDAFCFVRIARIGIAYKKSIEESINLIDQLLKSNIKNVHLYIIGTIEDEGIANEIKIKISNLPITLLTESQYTKRASDLLYVADAVIATGRGIMEATVMGLPVLTPTVNSDIPILVNENNFEGFFRTNFSQRNIATEESLTNNYKNICSLIENIEFSQKMREFSSSIFKIKFDLATGTIKYLEFYNNTSKIEQQNVSFLKNIKFQLKTLLTFFKNAK